MDINRKIKIWGVVLLVVVGVAGGILIMRGKSTLFKGTASGVAEVSIENPKGKNVEGKVIIEVNVAGVNDAQLKGVRFKINNQIVHTANDKPFKYEWDTTELENGSVTIKAEALNLSNTIVGSDQMIVMIDNSADVKRKKQDLGGEESPGIDQSQAILTVAKIEIAGANLAKQGEGAVIGKFKFSAAGEKIQIRNLKVHRSGSATVLDVPSVGFFEEESNRLLSKSGIPIPPVATETDAYQEELPAVWEIPAGQSRNLVIKSNIPQNAIVGHDIVFFFENSQSIKAFNEFSISNTFPVISETVTVAVSGAAPPPPPGQQAATLTITKSVDTPASGPAAKGSDVPVAKFSLAASGADVKVSLVKLTREGTATKDDIPLLLIYDAQSNALLSDETRNINYDQGTAYGVILPTEPKINAESTKNFLVKARMSANVTPNRTFTLGIQDNNSIAAITPDIPDDADFLQPTGSFPISFNTFTIGTSENQCQQGQIREENKCWDKQEFCNAAKQEFQRLLARGPIDEEALGEGARYNREYQCNIPLQAEQTPPPPPTLEGAALEAFCANAKTNVQSNIVTRNLDRDGIAALLIEPNLKGCDLVAADFCPANKPIRYEGQCFAQDELCTLTKANLISGIQSGEIMPAALTERLPEINTATGCSVVVGDIIQEAVTPVVPGTSTPAVAADTGTTTAATGTTTAAATTTTAATTTATTSASSAGPQEITVGASLPASQKSIIPPQQNQMVQLISIDIGATGTQAQEAKLKRIVLGYAGTFDVSKISELHLFREDGTEFGVGPFNKELTSLSKNPINGTVEIIFATTDPNATILKQGRRLVLYGKANATTDDSGKVMKYEIKAVETDPSAFSKPLIAVAGPEIGILAAETKTVATVTPPPPPPPVVAAETEASKAKAKTTKKAKELTKAELEQAALLAELQKTVGDLKTAAGAPQTGVAAGSAFASGAAGAQALRPVAASPALAGSQRLIRAPERSGTGPGVLVYFGILAAVQGGILIRKKFRSRR